VEAELFDRENRLAMLVDQICNPAPKSIFGEIFQQLKKQGKA
jgi:hypothetical protein